MRKKFNWFKGDTKRVHINVNKYLVSLDTRSDSKLEQLDDESPSNNETSLMKRGVSHLRHNNVLYRGTKGACILGVKCATKATRNNERNRNKGVPSPCYPPLPPTP